jgi:hypothetical protein
MLRRLIFSAAPVAFVLVAAASTPGAAPKTTRYRIESKTQQEIDLTIVGQPKQTTTVTQIALVSITLIDTVGGKVLHAVIDSIGVEPQVPEIATSAAKAKGAWIHGLIDSWGRTNVVSSSSDSNDVVAQLKPTLSRLFPVIKPGAKQADRWVDTANLTSKSSTQALKTVRVATYTHAGTGTWAGVAATRFDITSATSGAGTLENPNVGTMELELTSTGTESAYIAPDGTYVGGQSNTSGDSKIRAAMLPDAIPVKTTSSVTVTVIK